MGPTKVVIALVSSLHRGRLRLLLLSYSPLPEHSPSSTGPSRSTQLPFPRQPVRVSKAAKLQILDFGKMLRDKRRKKEKNITKQH